MDEIGFARTGALLLVACAVASVPVRGNARASHWICAWILPMGTLACALSLAIRWRLAAQGPFLTIYEVVLSNVFSLSAIFYLASRRWPNLLPAAPVALSVIALLALWCLDLPTAITPLPPSFDNPWLWAHVLSGKAFLGFYLISASLALHLLLQGRSAQAENPLDQQIWRFAALAFVFDSLMLVTGSVWAHDAWGHYWNWDPLESSALVTWLALAALLHSRQAFRLAAPTLHILVLIVFTLAFLTFFGLPFLSMAPHKGMF